MSRLWRVPVVFGDGCPLIDMSQLLSRASPDEVREVCQEAVHGAYPGYFVGSTTEADNSCKLEHLVAMHEMAMDGMCINNRTEAVAHDGLQPREKDDIRAAGSEKMA